MNNEIGFLIGLTIFFCLCALPSILNSIIMTIDKKEKDDDFVIPLPFDNENNICIFHNDTIIIYYSKNDLSIICSKLNNIGVKMKNKDELIKAIKELSVMSFGNNIFFSMKELTDEEKNNLDIGKYNPILHNEIHNEITWVNKNLNILEILMNEIEYNELNKEEKYMIDKIKRLEEIEKEIEESFDANFSAAIYYDSSKGIEIEPITLSSIEEHNKRLDIILSEKEEIINYLSSL